LLKKKIIVSACLLGEQCRYDAKIKEFPTLLEALSKYEVIPFCPEAPIFGTPRQRISVVQINGNNKIMTDETQEDVTEILEREVTSFLVKNPSVALVFQMMTHNTAILSLYIYLYMVDMK